jgi:hypothetical protein
MKKPPSIDGLVFWFALLIVGVLCTFVIAMAQENPPSALDSVAQINVETKSSGKRQAPPVAPQISSPTDPCQVPSANGIAAPGFGFSRSVNRDSGPCNMREDIRLLWNVGQFEVARLLSCKINTVQDAGLAAVCERNARF